MTVTETKPEITVHAELPFGLYRPVWDMYLKAFEPMRTLAPQRHVMWWEEFTDMMADDRVSKVLLHAGDTPLGLACYTNVLTAVPLIEPAYFRAREPKLAELNHIWYTAFVCVRQDRPRPGASAFKRLICKLAEPIVPVHGVCFMDYATVRVNQGLPEKANRLLGAEFDGRSEYEEVGAQHYYGYYPGGRPE
jgi:hypothetical protein